jgi:hypothetical protein
MPTESVLIQKPAPRARNIPASVIRNGGSRKKQISEPMPAPSAEPAASPSVHASPGAIWCFSISVAVKIEVNPMTAPTDRSMPPEKSTSVMPTAAMPRNTFSESRPMNTRAEKKPS